jgi:drug/metabolite transporter (DMT)-like permease
VTAGPSTELAAPGTGASTVSPGRWIPSLLLLSAIWGSSFLFIKIGVSELPALFVALGRVAGGALALLVVVALTQDRLPRDLRTWGHHAVVAVVGVIAPFSLFAFGEQRVSSVLAGIWNSITPLVVLPMAVLVFRTEKMTARRLTGLILGLLGALAILGVWQGVGGSSLTGQLMCLAAASCYGVSIPYVRRYVTPLPASGVVSSLCQLLIASALLAVVAPVFSDGFPDVLALSWPVVASVAALGVLGTGLAFVLHLRNIRLVGASNASTVTYIIPIFATIIGVVVLREPLEWFAPVGAAIVLLGVAVASGIRLGRRR